jgi:hypothetical protein
VNAAQIIPLSRSNLGTLKRKRHDPSRVFSSFVFSVTPCLRGDSGIGGLGRTPHTKLISHAIHKRAQLAQPRRMPQLAQRFGFDLADAFAGYGEGLADLFQRVLAAVF